MIKFSEDEWIINHDSENYKRMKIEDDIDFDKIAEITDGFSGADLKAVCTEAGMFAIRNNRKIVITKDFLDAIDKIIDSAKVSLQLK